MIRGNWCLKSFTWTLYLVLFSGVATGMQDLLLLSVGRSYRFQNSRVFGSPQGIVGCLQLTEILEKFDFIFFGFVLLLISSLN